MFAMNSDVVMMNEYARQTLDPADQTVLLGRAAAALASRHVDPVAVELPTGVEARIYCRPVPGEVGLASGVVHVKLLEPSSRRLDTRTPARMYLPGLVGSGPLWLRGCHRVDAAQESGEWLALDGEPGVGKLAVLRAVHYRRNPAGRFQVVDAAEATGAQWLAEVRQELLDPDGSLVIRHVDRLDARRLQVLTGAVQEARAAGRHRSLWVAVTLGQAPEAAQLADLLRLFPSTVELPPLRHHVEDVHELVPHFLAKLSSEGRLGCSPEAMQLLLRTPWPGNAEQLWQVLRRVVLHRRTGSIRSRRPAARVPDSEPPAAQPAGADGARRHRAEPARFRGQQGESGGVTGHVPGDDLPQDPGVRHRCADRVDCAPSLILRGARA